MKYILKGMSWGRRKMSSRGNYPPSLSYRGNKNSPIKEKHSSYILILKFWNLFLLKMFQVSHLIASNFSPVTDGEFFGTLPQSRTVDKCILVVLTKSRYYSWKNLKIIIFWFDEWKLSRFFIPLKKIQINRNS